MKNFLETRKREEISKQQDLEDAGREGDMLYRRFRVQISALTGRLKDFVQVLHAYMETLGHPQIRQRRLFLSPVPFHYLLMIFTIPGYKSDLQTALLYQKYLDETRDP